MALSPLYPANILENTYYVPCLVLALDEPKLSKSWPMYPSSREAIHSNVGEGQENINLSRVWFCAMV